MMPHATATIHAAVVRMSKLIDPLQMTQESDLKRIGKNVCPYIRIRTYIHTYIHAMLIVDPSLRQGNNGMLCPAFYI